MALTYADISAITEKKFIPKMVDNIFDSNPLLQILKEKSYEKVDGGTSIMIPLNFSGVSATGWFSGSDTLDSSSNDVLTAAEYNWKQIFANVAVTRIDELKNSGDAAKLNLVKQKVQVAEKTIADGLGTGLYNAGTDSKAIGGLRLICGTSNTVGGISQTSYSWWASQVDSTTTTTTIKAMQALYNLCTIGNDSPDVIMTTRTLFNSFYSLLQPQQRFVDSKSAEAGFSSLLFNGSKVLADSHCTSNYMFMLNTKYLMLAYHPEENFKFQPFQSPINQAVKVAKIFWAGNLCSSNNRMLGMFSGLTS